MGIYVNPVGEPKESWLANHGELLLDPPKWEDVKEGSLPVCLVDNGPFKAAAVIYSKSELEEFSSPTDPRPKVWFMAKISDLEPVCGEPIVVGGR